MWRRVRCEIVVEMLETPASELNVLNERRSCDRFFFLDKI